MWVEHTFLTLLLVQTGMEDVGTAEERSGDLLHHKLNDRLILQLSHFRTTTSNVPSGRLNYPGNGVKWSQIRQGKNESGNPKLLVSQAS